MTTDSPVEKGRAGGVSPLFLRRGAKERPSALIADIPEETGG
jgi:hypothetical protein